MPKEWATTGGRVHSHSLAFEREMSLAMTEGMHAMSMFWTWAGIIVVGLTAAIGFALAGR